MKGLKLFALVMLTLVMLSTVAVGSFAAITNPNTGQPFVNIDKIEVNNQVLVDNSPVYLEREQEVVVAVYFTGNVLGKCKSGNDNLCYNTRVSAEIDGYEYGIVGDVEGQFEVEPGVQYRKVLRFKLPEDMTASDDLQLNVEIKDDDDLILARFPVRIQEIRHKLNIFDAIFNPTNNVQAGQPLFTNVRLENLGDNVESSIKVTVAVPSLGIQTSEYVDKLTTLQETDNDEDTNDAATSNDLMLMIPQNTPEGDYNVLVTLEYNRGRGLEQKTYKMHVKGTPIVIQTKVTQPTATVNVDSPVQRVTQGNGAVFKVSVGNIGDQATPYTISLVGADAWASTRVDPSTLVVQPDSASDGYVYVAPKEGVEGIKTFTLKVMSGNNLLAEKNLSLEVVKAKSTDLKTVFTWIFLVLLIILVILVIVVLVKKYSSKEDKSIEGQTYY